MENTLGLRISEKRRALSLTQSELAEHLGVTHQAVSQWERGDTCPDIMLLPHIARELGCTVDSLFGESSARSTARRTAHGTAVITDEFPDDGKVRIVAFIGSRMISAEETERHTKTVKVKLDGLLRDVESRIGIECGDIGGNASAGHGMSINGNVGGNTTSGGGMSINGSVNGTANCGGGMSIGGNVAMAANCGGAMVVCGDVKGGVRAGGDINIEGSVEGSVKGEKDITVKGNIGGNAQAAVSITAGGEINGSRTPHETVTEIPENEPLYAAVMVGNKVVKSEKIAAIAEKLTFRYEGRAKDVVCAFNLECDDIRGNVSAGGNIAVNGDISGNVNAKGSAAVGSDIGGSLSAEGEATVGGDVGGHVAVSGMLTIGGDVNGHANTAGELTIGGDVDGNVSGRDIRIEGDVDGDVKAEGNVTVEGDVDGDITCGGECNKRR